MTENLVLSNAVTVYRRYISSKMGGEGTDFLLKRGLDPILIDWFKLGLTPPNKMFTKMMTIEKYGYCSTEESMIACGLLFLQDKNTIKEFFYNSIIIPVFDTFDNVLTITARCLGKTKSKYMNLPHIPLDMLFGLHLVKNRHMLPNIKGMPENAVLLCEGQFDTMAATQNGYFSLGLLGANSFRENMLETLCLYSSIILCLDNDAPGKKAQDIIAQRIRYYLPHIKIYTTNIPEKYNDINDFFLDNRNENISYLLEEVNPKPFPFKAKIKEKTVRRLGDLRNADMLTVLLSTLSYHKINVGDTTNTTNRIVCNCPFYDHNDVIGSFTIYTETNSFYCFGCGRGGSPDHFIKYFYNKTEKV